jgi:sulfonate transport system ATP-binding protein
MALLNPRLDIPATRVSVGDTVAEVHAHHRSFGSTRVLSGVDLTLRRGEFVALLGRSGSGKSTLLRSLAGLDPTPRDEVCVTGRATVAFQEPRLLPWRKVRQNVELAVLNTVAAGPRPARVRAALEEVSLSEKADAWPGQLSGGQAQRVSLARALVSEPDLLLLDEPFSALDALTRIEMHSLVTQLWERHEPAILLVTHDVDEALALADRVLVLDAGVVAREWEVPVRRTARSPEHHEIAQLREEVLRALGVSPGHEARSAEPHQFARNTETERSGAA